MISSSQSLPSIRSNRIRPTEQTARVELVVAGRGVDIALPNSARKAPAVIRREETRVLVAAAEDGDLIGPEAFGPRCTGVVSNVDADLERLAADTVAEGVEDKGRGGGCETKYEGDGGGEGKLHFDEGKRFGSGVIDWESIGDV